MLEKFEKLIEKIEILLPVGDEETIDAAFHELLDEVASYTNNEYRTFNDFQLFFVTNRLLAKNFIRKNDNLTLMIRAVEWRLAYEDIISNASVTERVSAVKYNYFGLFKKGERSSELCR